MEIELKKITYNAQLDEDAFIANLILDGTKAGTVTRKDGKTQYYATEEIGMDLISKAEEYMKKLPAEKKLVDGKEQAIKLTLADKIDGLFASHLTGIEQKKFDRKVELIQKRNIVVGESGRYMRTIPTKALVNLLVQGNNTGVIKDILARKVIPNMTENEIILNKNIPEILLKEAGLKEGQYTSNKAENPAKKAANKVTRVKP